MAEDEAKSPAQSPSSHRKNQDDHNDSMQTSDSKASRDGRHKQKEFFKEELKRLKISLKKEAEKVVAPPIKEHVPYIFNALDPYYDVGSARFLIELPEPARTGYVSRQTSIGLCDPWDNHRMDKLDKQFMLPPVDAKPDGTPRQKRNNGRSTQSTAGQKDRPPKEGSTRLPKFPAVRVQTDQLNNKPLYYSDVPMLRSELRKKYSSCASDKVKEDYKRTKADFFRMELDRMEAYHPSNRPHMRSAYFAYLQNTPGSRQAVYECVGSYEKNQQNNQQTSTPQGVQTKENVAS